MTCLALRCVFFLFWTHFSRKNHVIHTLHSPSDCSISDCFIFKIYKWRPCVSKTRYICSFSLGKWSLQFIKNHFHLRALEGCANSTQEGTSPFGNWTQDQLAGKSSAAYLSRPIWILRRCSPGHCRIPATGGWRWRWALAPTWTSQWRRPRRGPCCLCHHRSGSKRKEAELHLESMASDGISDPDLRHVQKFPLVGCAANLQDVALGEMKGPGGNVDALSSLHLKNTTFFNGTVVFFIYVKS